MLVLVLIRRKVLKEALQKEIWTPAGRQVFPEDLEEAAEMLAERE